GWAHTPPSKCTTTGAKCAQVDVYRDGTNSSNTLPTFFANIFGQGSQGIRATATAIVAVGNATNCLRPFGVVDKWQELEAPSGEFDRWTKVSGNAVESTPHDTYAPPNATDTGTGYKASGTPNDVGTRVTLKGGNNHNSSAG